MDTKFDFDGETEDRIVYIREVSVADLPQEVQDELGEVDHLYAAHDMNGERLALFKDRKLAFSVAREYDYAPVSVH
ncbi:DUF1150 family protein [Thioclava sp. BHET1]|uniref:DUF1150 domain-containing protein n=1 Tax=Thioclava dalianensis TaxID=1185766 RepID=A0A074THT3_9RHOB|nr:DUF1150 family protein [Thioclava dalianensis]KEP71231.1 hypothetical protein DL1_06425 [Thioclava dalianensis]TMV88135.1 DUF1150 family protein [Thioclava sp. BHET1]SFM74921.1 hypothetical protein SAMN05216224_101131 [Thioclava dalianensis]